VTTSLSEESLRLEQGQSTKIRIAVQVPPDHHGYLDKGDEGLLIPFSFTFAAVEERGIRVTMVSRPTGERDDKVQATVLRGDGEFVFRLDADTTTGILEGTFPTVLRYQICNDVTNICYPPRTSQITLRFVGTPTSAGSLVKNVPQHIPAASITISERITALFQQYTGHFFVAFGLVCLAGLVASATPCVYPILPITSALLAARGHGSRRHGHLHALVYFCGIIVFYTLLGLFAAVTGTALSVIMTSGWVNLGFAILFAYFGLSMLGLYEFHFMPALTAKIDAISGRRAGLSGTLLMGTTAGLVVSPCVGPIAGAILLQITGQTAGVESTGDTVTTSMVMRGLTLMTGFGIGLGLPFLLVGIASHRLPRSGPWLTRVKCALGLPILYFAYTYYVKGMTTLGVAEPIAHALLAGVMAIGVAVFLGAFHPLAAQPQRSMLLRRTCGIILLIVGGHFLYNGLGQSGLLLDPSLHRSAGLSNQTATGAMSSASQVEIHGNLRWLRDFSVAQQRANAEHKPLFVDFYATWCANCIAFQKLTLTNSALNTALQQVVLVKIYDTDPIFPFFQQDRHYPELKGVGGQPFLPLFAIYSPEGELTWKGQNYQAVDTMIAQLEHAKRVVTR
jgi:thiol:disulfide interchange protein DsbD